MMTVKVVFSGQICGKIWETDAFWEFCRESDQSWNKK